MLKEEEVGIRLPVNIDEFQNQSRGNGEGQVKETMEGSRKSGPTLSSVRRSNRTSNTAAPVQITEDVGEKHQFRLNEEALKKILLSPEVADKKVAVISIAGAFRKGKSFLLNFFLRFLSASKEAQRSGNWIYCDGNVGGFSWRGGSTRDTTGMLMWSRPFLVTRDGEEIAIILMDTQGTFDNQSTMKDCATIFALSTMISSLQIYNLKENVQENDLQSLQLFTDYGRLALENTAVKPFQSLLFLIRDWSFPYEKDYGFDGGQKLLDQFLQIPDKQHEELQNVRRHIRSCFKQISCFLMPNPGSTVASSGTFCGNIDEVDKKFLQQLHPLISNLMDSDKLVLKQINGREVTCRELMEYIKAYVTAFEGDDLPEPTSLFEATAKANNFVAVSKSKAHYIANMEKNDASYMSEEELAAKHGQYCQEAIDKFESTKKMGGEEFSKKYLEILKSAINERYKHFTRENDARKKKSLLNYLNEVLHIAVENCTEEHISETRERILDPTATAVMTAAGSLAGPIGAALGFGLSNLFGQSKVNITKTTIKTAEEPVNNARNLSDEKKVTLAIEIQKLVDSSDFKLWIKDKNHQLAFLDLLNKQQKK